MLPLSQRGQVASIIGQEAEAIVYLYCSCDRDFTFSKLSDSKAIAFKDRFANRTFSLTDQQAREFCELTVANELEWVIASKKFKAQHGKGLERLFNKMQPWLSNSAINAYPQALREG